jgi:hypothetical protein
MPARGVSAVAVGCVGAGLLLVWSGLTGASVLASIQDLVQGKKPSPENAHPITAQVAAAAAKVAAGAAAAARKAGATPQPDLPSGSGNASKATPPTVGTSPLPRLPVVAPPRQTTPQTRLTAPPKKSKPWWEFW